MIKFHYKETKEGFIWLIFPYEHPKQSEKSFAPVPEENLCTNNEETCHPPDGA